MNDTKLRALISRAVALDRQIAELHDALAEAKAALLAEARSRAEEHEPVAEGGGTKWCAQGLDGSLCRVVFPAPKLRAQVNPATSAGQRILGLCGQARAALFTTDVIYRPVEDFRERARQLLGRAAARLIRACETESAPRIEFETKPES
jgi:hypothetical protein